MVFTESSHSLCRNITMFRYYVPNMLHSHISVSITVLVIVEMQPFFSSFKKLTGKDKPRLNPHGI